MPVKNKMDFKKVQSIFFFIMIAIFSIAVLYIFQPFFYPMFWAAVLAVMFYPLYIRLEKFIKIPSLSSIIILVFVVALVVLPLLTVAMLLIQESAMLYQNLTETNLFGSVQNISTHLDQIPVIGPYLDQAGIQGSAYATNAAKTISLFLLNNITSIAQNSIQFLLMAMMTLYTLFFFLKDGKRMLTRLMHLCPLGDEYEEMLYQRFTSTARATLKGTLVVGAVQGLIGGLLFWFIGIDGALVWGVLMALFSLIPAVGAAIIWLPAGLILLALGNVSQGITILAVGTLLISTIDNVIRPPLVGKDTQMHPILILFSTLGGIALFGISGFVIGPVITALFLAVVTIYEHYYKRELQNN